jgi:hypothetical protein
VLNMTAAMVLGFLDHSVTFFPTGRPPEHLTIERVSLVKTLASFVNAVIKDEKLSLFLKLTTLTPTEEKQP